MDKRTFLKNITLTGLASSPMYKNLDKIINQYAHYSVEEIAEDEDFWARVRGEYRLKPDYINLENGYYCFKGLSHKNPIFFKTVISCSKSS